jgi:hypothetical protein
VCESKRNKFVTVNLVESVCRRKLRQVVIVNSDYGILHMMYMMREVSCPAKNAAARVEWDLIPIDEPNVISVEIIKSDKIMSELMRFVFSVELNELKGISCVPNNIA